MENKVSRQRGEGLYLMVSLGLFMMRAPSPNSVKKYLWLGSWYPEHPWSEEDEMVVGEPGLPIGSWRDQFERSKLPPGAQLGLRAETRNGRRKRR